jgi:hypothetical protein
MSLFSFCRAVSPNLAGSQDDLYIFKDRLIDIVCPICGRFALRTLFEAGLSAVAQTFRECLVGVFVQLPDSKRFEESKPFRNFGDLLKNVTNAANKQLLPSF